MIPWSMGVKIAQIYSCVKNIYAILFLTQELLPAKHLSSLEAQTPRYRALPAISSAILSERIILIRGW